MQSPDPDVPDRLRTHVSRLAGLIGARYVGRPSSLGAAASLIEREFASGGECVTRETYSVGEQSVSNVILERRGLHRPDEILILGAHYDTIEGTPGADDNASAVAVMMEAARLLQGCEFARTVRFVAFACEEPPYFYTQEMGSAVHAAGCRKRGEKLVGALVLEMVGYYTDSPNSQKAPDELPR